MRYFVLLLLAALFPISTLAEGIESLSLHSPAAMRLSVAPAKAKKAKKSKKAPRAKKARKAKSARRAKR